jgi:predicted Rossmann fold flavoprotein
MKNFDVIIIGAGAAGLMCAARAGQRGRSVLLLEHGDKIGSKILISGGGRCNFTNREASPDRFLSQNPHFCKSALKTYTQHDFIALVEKHKIAYHEKTLGQLFCDHTARDIVTMLADECRTGGVKISLNQPVLAITKADVFCVQTRDLMARAPALVLATGGLSIPKMGATGFTHQIAKQFEIPLTELRPALVPLVLEGGELASIQALSGISLEVAVRCGKHSFRDGMVMTHRGLSGPAILQISSYWREGTPITLDLLPGLQTEDFLLERKRSRPKAELKTILGEVLPQRLAQVMTTTYFVNEPAGNLPDKKLKEFSEFLRSWRLLPVCSEGYAKAEVTLGGVDTAALSSKTMMVKQVPGLFIIGEAVDVTGWLGGYNFQWAWSSGWAAGSAV